MNLDTGTYRPYRKPDNMRVYISRKSHHLPIIIKEIPEAIAKRVTDISSSEVVFNDSTPLVVFMTTLHLSQKLTTPRQKDNCKIIWFNSPY